MLTARTARVARGAVVRGAVGGLVVALAWLVPAAPVGAQGTVDAKGVALAPTATCAYGDVDITYEAAGVDHEAVRFTAAGGAVLQERTSKAFQPTFSGVEHVLAETSQPPAPGSVVAVRVVVGAAPASTATAAEFVVVYRCDAQGNRSGGRNEVVWTCWGDLGACPADADAGLAAAAVPGAVPGEATVRANAEVVAAPTGALVTAAPAAAVRARALYTG